MNRTILGLTLLALGIALAVVAGLAQPLGLTITPSKAGTDTFGWKQVVGVAAGVALALAGLVVATNARRDDGEGRSASPDNELDG